MKISKIKIKNFRCFGPKETTIIFKENLAAFIGANSSGKTAAIQALVKLFGIYQKDRTLEKSDFHVGKNIIPSTINRTDMSIEVILEFPELDGDKDCGDSVAPFFNNMIVNSPSQMPYNRIRLEATWEKSNLPEGNIQNKLYFITISEEEESQKDTCDEKNYKIEILPQQRSEIHVIYVPAVREPSNQLKYVSGTIFSRVINEINWPEDIDDQLKNQYTSIDKLFDKINGVKEMKTILQEQWNTFHRDERYSNLNINFSSNSFEDLLKKLEINFCPTETGSGYSVNRLGDGLQSLFYISLVTSLLELESKAKEEASTCTGDDCLTFNSTPPSLTVLAIEEPENHVSPHILGQVVQNLLSIAKIPNTQVVISSHTPAVVGRVQPDSIVHFRIDKNTYTTLTNCLVLPDDDSAYKYVKEAILAYPELYFSRLVILGEGDSEEVIIRKCLNSYGYISDFYSISVVPLGGRHVNYFWKLLNQLNIPYITILDFDRERYLGDFDRIKYVYSELLKHTPLQQLKYKKYRPLRKGTKQKIQYKESCNIDEIYSYIDDMKNSTKPVKYKIKIQNNLIEILEGYNVFFSHPLDIDFMMFEKFSTEYISILDDNERGPNINDISKLTQNSKKNILDIVLKDKRGSGKSYTDEQIITMSWYKFFFLGNRGKPVTHITALQRIEDKLFHDNMPSPLKRLVERCQTLLNEGELND